MAELGDPPSDIRELSSAYWGRGLACEAVQAMLRELVAQYGVRRLSAVLKRENQRSLRLLQRLGFVVGAAERAIAPGEVRMQRQGQG